jgi:hypothetical protein
VRLAALGRGEFTNDLGRRLPVDGPRVEYDHGDVLAWYVNRPSGLEQGFTILRPASQREGAAVRIDMALAWGEIVSLSPESCELELRPESGPLLRYGHLVGWMLMGLGSMRGRERGGATRITILVEDQGAKYPIVVDPTFTRAAKLWETTGPMRVAASGTHSGLAVAIEGDRLVVGSWGSESVFVFERIAGSWELSQRLVASDTRPLDQLGAAVALSGDRILAGALEPTGSRVRTKVPSTSSRCRRARWVEEAKITPADPQRGSLFGSAVAIDRDTAVIGNQANPLGGAYVFVRVGAAWLEEQKLPRPGNAALMGWAVAVQGDTAVIGAPGTSLPLTLPGQQGAAYVFRRAGALWELEAALLPSAPEGLGWFGAACVTRRRPVHRWSVCGSRG